MPYNEDIDRRIRDIVERWPNREAKKMFGGVCHLLNGNIVCGVYKDFLILRMGENAAEKALQKAHVHPFDITGRPMRGWVMVEAKGFAGPQKLKKWLEAARMFVDSLPAK